MLKYRAMIAKIRRRLFFIAAFSVIAIGAAASLVTNMKTLPLIENRRELLLKSQEFEAENRRLEFLVVSANKLTNVNKKAKELNLRATKKIRYIPAL